MPARALSAAILVSSLVVGGCGQTGALHLPADAPSREAYLIGSNPNAKKKGATTPAPAAAETPADAPVTP